MRPPLPLSPPWHSHEKRCASDAQHAESGFSLVEVLMGVVILAGALGMAAAMNGVATRGLKSSTILNDRNAAVDADIAMVRSMAERYTWCSGAPSLEASDTPTCLGNLPSDESYFSPAVSQDDALIYEEVGNPSKANFEQACRDGTLSDGLIQRINDRPTPAGFSRTAAGINSGGERTHRIQVLYQTARTDENPVVRSVVITPPVAFFCP